MKRLFGLCLLAAVSLSAQTAETYRYRAVLTSTNEVPVVAIDATGKADIRIHVMRNAAGDIVSGSVDFIVNHNIPGPAGVVGLHIHRGGIGVNGPVVINTGIAPAAPLMSETGRGTIVRQAQVAANDVNGIAALKDILTNRTGFYVNLHTLDFSGGIMRGQLEYTEYNSLVVNMSPANENPAIPNTVAAGAAAVTIYRTFDINGEVSSGQAVFELDYNLGQQYTLTGFHIHRGVAGVNGPVVIDSGINATNNILTTENGRGTLVYNLEIPINETNKILLSDLFENPSSFYLNLHTTVNPGGFIRGQLQTTELTTYDVVMSPANENPPIAGLNAAGVGKVYLYTGKNADGVINAANFIFDVNYRFPDAAEFTGFHIHEGAAGVNGPVRINTGIDGGVNVVPTTTGFGNLFRPIRVADATGLGYVNAILKDPAGWYINLHTRVNPGGAIRAQLPANK